jgi:hypothetical protein
MSMSAWPSSLPPAVNRPLELESAPFDLRLSPAARRSRKVAVKSRDAMVVEGKKE